MLALMRLLYLYPEEWTGHRAREVHTLSTCIALAQEGVDVTLVTAGGKQKLHEHLRDIAGRLQVAGLTLVTLSRRWGPVRSSSIFKHQFHTWRRNQPRFDCAYIIHLKAAAMLVHEHVMPYAYEAHEIFAQTPQRSPKKESRLHELERHVLAGAGWRIATSAPLAAGLSTWFTLPNDFAVVPNAGLPPLPARIGAPEGPFVYCGSISDWKGLHLAIQGSHDAGVALKIVGGTREEWKRLGESVDTAGIEWHPRVTLAALPSALAGACAGLIPTQPESPSGRYSCPMKLFDYARCGLEVITTALPSLQSLELGSWARQVEAPTREAWAAALRDFRFDIDEDEAARAWAANHTWAKRAERIITVLRKKA